MTTHQQLVTNWPSPSWRSPATLGRRWSPVAYAVACYLVALSSLLYMAGFLADVLVPRDVDTGPTSFRDHAVARDAVLDVALVVLFAVQHSVMARGSFKRILTLVVPAAMERSTYVLASSLALLSLMWWWQPIPVRFWQLTGWPRLLVLLVYGAGWALALAATFQISHTGMFGLRQAWAAARRHRDEPLAVTEAGLYRYVRHPLMTGLLVVVWAAPTMTVGHLGFAVAMTGYVLVGTAFEERDLLAEHGAGYRDYREITPALVPTLARHPRRTRTPGDNRRVP